MKRSLYVEEVVEVGQVEGYVRICLFFEIGAPSLVQRFRVALPATWGNLVVVGIHHKADLVDVSLQGQRTFAHLVERQHAQAHDLVPAIGRIPETISTQDLGRILEVLSYQGPNDLAVMFYLVENVWRMLTEHLRDHILRSTEDSWPSGERT